MIKPLLVLSILFNLVLVGGLYAEDDSFFGDDFSINPLETSTESIRAPRKEKHQKTKSPLKSQKKDLIRADQPLEEPEIERQGDSTTLPIQRLSLVVNSTHPSHLREALRTFSDIVFSRGVKPGTITAVGGDSPVQAEFGLAQLKKLISLGGSLSGATRPPPKFSIKSSPAWIFECDSGYYLLEGETDIARFISANGEFNIYKLGKSAALLGAGTSTKASASDSTLTPAERVKRVQEKLKKKG